MFLNITYLISSRIGNASQRSRTVSLINTHYISGWQNGDCQTFAKGLFLLTNCSRGFHSVHLLVRRQSSSAASLSLSLLSSSKRVAGANSVNICQRCCLTNWAIADVGQDAFDVERMSTTTGNVPSGLTFCRQANRIFYDGNFKVRFIFYIYRY
jgi:hypothetical protein